MVIASIYTWKRGFHGLVCTWTRFRSSEDINDTSREWNMKFLEEASPQVNSRSVCTQSRAKACIAASVKPKPPNRGEAPAAQQAIRGQKLHHMTERKNHLWAVETERSAAPRPTGTAQPVQRQRDARTASEWQEREGGMERRGALLLDCGGGGRC